MRIACVQFAPKTGSVSENVNFVDKVLNEAHPQNIDILVLPEMGFAGNNFKSTRHISPCLERTRSGITRAWARYTALDNDCMVVIGYPEKIDVAGEKNLKCYNSAIAIDRDGDTIANHRKCLLDNMDKPWALEGFNQFTATKIPVIGNFTIGIAYEFAYHVLLNDVKIAIIPMAWKIHDPKIGKELEEPDWDTLLLWIERLDPLVQAEDQGEVIVIITNRCGVEEEETFAGTSCVLSILNREIKILDVLGYGEQGVLVVDTSQPPKFTVVNEVATDSQGKRDMGSLGHIRKIPSGNQPRHETAEYQKVCTATTSLSSSTLVLGLEEHL